MGLDVSGVSVNFGGVAALSDVSIQAHDAQITGLIGPNGAGKTTLFNVVVGMQRSSRGSVRLDGHTLDGLPPYRRARLGLGRTFQRLELFGTLTVRENIKVAAAMRVAHRSRGADCKALTDEILGRLGLDALGDVRADTLPTGTGRLLELGRALATQPRVLLLDEPASGQDHDEAESFARILHELARDGVAVVMVEHDMGLVMGECDRVVVLDGGSVISVGSPDQVREDPVVQHAYLGSERAKHV
jgi:branched-chain amino acid transport system ATP-binding protein